MKNLNKNECQYISGGEGESLDLIHGKKEVQKQIEIVLETGENPSQEPSQEIKVWID